jgi:arylsulfatase
MGLQSRAYSLVSAAVLLTIGSLALSACGGSSSSSPPAISLVKLFSDAEITGGPVEVPEYPRLEWRFDGKSTIPQAPEPGPYAAWTPLNAIEQVKLEDGKLIGRITGKYPIIAVKVPRDALPGDLLAAIEVRVRASAGTEFGVLTLRDEEIELEKLIKDFDEGEGASFQTEFEPGDEIQTIKLTERDVRFTRTTPLRSIRHFGLMFFEAEGAEFEVESVRLISRNEQLAGAPSGVGWQGLSNIYRETIVARSPEQIAFEVDLGSKPWLDLAIGTPNPNPVTFHIDVEASGSETVSLRRTVTSADQWLDMAIPLDALAGKKARISLGLESDEQGQVAFWGAPTIRHRGALPSVSEPTPARAALGNTGPPRGVILIVADTLRKDHLDAWGYERETAPALASLAAEGTRFADNISQGSWTKVAVNSILTSLYRSTHGIFDVPHRLPASVTTLAEAFRDAGYATFHTASVVFSGRNSNLQQGVEVLHERASIDGLEGYSAKTSRTYVDRLLPWLEAHQDQPFFVFLHVFDPHSPFRPFDPYDRRWIDDEALTQHEQYLEKIDEVVDVFHNLPSAEELEKAGPIDPEKYLTVTKAWYDASIKAMDVEIARLVERLEEMGLADDTLVAFVADHGEEFLEHGQSWHGHSLYGDMIDVPMLMRWPGVVPADRVIEQTTQSIDLMPTLLELAQIPVPELAQGRSLVPLMAAGENLAEFGWRGGPVFSELKNADEFDDFVPDAYTVIHDDWKLIWNVKVRDERPEIELFDHEADPLNLTNIAEANPEKVEELKRLIEGWRATAEAARVTDEGLEESLSPEEIEELRALGYLN